MRPASRAGALTASGGTATMPAMCGIAGIVRPRIVADGEARASLERELRGLAACLRHRGPDADGFAIEGRVGLAHRRLSIVDLSPTGSQPMWTPDRRHVIVFNGEIYNFPVLRRELEARGERFAGRGDTEVALRLVSRDGAAALARLDGMFALALLDTATGELLLARDRSGQKPLYVARLAGGGFAFASELRPLLDVQGVDARISPDALLLYLALGFLPAPYTLRAGITQLLPGETLRLSADGSEQRGRFTRPLGPGPVDPSLRDFDTAVAALEGVLSDAVRAHLISDVPVGVLLSGGVDSSTVAAMAARHVAKLRTFSVVHRDPRYDESAAARAVAERIGSEHHEIELPEEGLSEADLDVLVDHHGDPFADSSSLNVLRLSREMRRHVTVALSGDGGDEVFAGYPRFAFQRLLDPLSHVPAPLLRAAARAGSALGSERARQGARACAIAAMPRARRFVAYTSLFWPEEATTLLQPGIVGAAPGASLDRLLDERGASSDVDPVAAAHWLEQQLVLPDDMLTKVDRMAMSASLEVRPPLLGTTVLDFAAALPFPLKNRGREGKRVLRALARRLVPPWVVDRPKQGFALPLARHGGRVFEEASRFALESEASPLRALFRSDALAELARSLRDEAPARDAEDSAFRRVHRRWSLALLARTLERHGGSL